MVDEEFGKRLGNLEGSVSNLKRDVAVANVGIDTLKTNMDRDIRERKEAEAKRDRADEARRERNRSIVDWVVKACLLPLIVLLVTFVLNGGLTK